MDTLFKDKRAMDEHPCRFYLMKKGILAKNMDQI